jgi:predicted alpha/beta-hydrolase family hydrolase
MSRPRREQLTLAVPHPHVDRVAAVLDLPEGPPRERAVLLAHGSGGDMHSEFLSAMARGLAERGFPVMRFRYPYMERIAREGVRRPPDRRPLLEATHAAALEELTRRFPGAPPLLAGKSLGARMGTYVAAGGADVAGLVLLGYPLHPAGRPETERSEHFPALVQPALFVQGTRDALCDLERLRRALAHYGGEPTLAVIEAADHSFEVLVRSGRRREQVWAEILERVAAWERRTFGP